MKENNSSEVEKNSETEDKNTLNKSNVSEDGFVYPQNDVADIVINLKDEDQDKDEEEIEVNLKNVTLSSVESEVHQKEIDALNKTNALNKSDISEDEDHKENESGGREQNDQEEETVEIEVKAYNDEHNKNSAEDKKDNNKERIIEKVSKVSIEENNSSEVEKNSETEDKNEDEEEIEINLENITLSSFESGVHKKEIDDLNKTNALNKSNVSKDKDHEENDSGEKEQNDQKTEIMKLVSETESNIDKNQKKGIPAPNSTLNIALLVNDSESFADFFEKLTGSDKNIDLSRLDFGGVSLCFLNCCRAFFLTLFDGLGLNGFWNRLCLRVFFENARSKGKSYCFEVPKIQNDQSQDPNTLNKPQYEQNIYWLSSAINKAKQQVAEETGIDVNNRNPNKQQLH